MDPVLVEIERRRIEAGLTARELSDLAGLSVAGWSKIRRTNAGTLYTLRRLCDALDVDLVVTTKPLRTIARPLVPCGTVTGSRRHWARGEKPCDPCRAAGRAYDRDRARAKRAQKAAAA